MDPQETETAALSSSHSAYQNTLQAPESSSTSREDGSSRPDRPASKDDSTLAATIEDGKEVTESKDQSLHPEDEKSAVLKDIEKGMPAGEQPKTEAPKDHNLVSWDGPNDPKNPKNWTRRKKWAATIIVATYAFISPLSSTMMAPALDVIAKAFNIGSSVESEVSLSIFVLAYALGPLFLAPLSEIFGRALVLQLSALFYLAFNIGCGFCTSKSQLIVFRFLSGLGGSAPLAVGGGVLADCWKPEERGRALSIYSLAPLLGPVIGPIAGGFITEYTTWRWVFWSSSIAAGVIQAFGFIFFAETYPPTLLQWKVQRLRTETGNKDLHTPFETPEKSMANTLKTGFIRPFRLIGTQIVVQIMGLYMAYIYGTLYLVIATFPVLWEGQYHESIGIGVLNYISLGLGFFVGAYTCALLQDRVYSALKKRHNAIGRPEFRIPLMVPGSMLMPIGLFWYGWSAQAHVHWIVPNIGACVFGAGVIIGFQCILTFLVDTYTRYAASAIGAATVLRSLCGFCFPLFAPAMYDKLHYGWGNSLLAFVAIFLGVPGPLLLWKYGEILRAKSPFAAGGGHH